MRNLSILAAFFCAIATDEGLGDELTFESVEIVVGDVLVEEGGGWEASNSPLTQPLGIDFNEAGQLFIVELSGGRIHRQDPVGDLLWISGDGTKSYMGDGGPLNAATFNGMHNCAITPSGDIYIADSWNHCVRKIDGKTMQVSTFAGTGDPGFEGDGGPASRAKFNFIMCITLNSDGDVLHVADLKNRRIRAIDINTGLVTTIAGNGKKGTPSDGQLATNSPLVDPRAVAADSKGNLYILERSGHALRVVSPDRTIRTVAGTGEKGFLDGDALLAQFDSPKHICVDSSDNVYIADDRNAAIRLYSPSTGKVSTVLGRGHREESLRLKNPHGVCWHQETLYVVDSGNNRILRLTSEVSEVPDSTAKSPRP